MTATIKTIGFCEENRFYDFGHGRIGHAVFTAPNGICQDMKHGKGVSYKLVTNYIDFPDYPSPENILIITAQGKYLRDEFILDSTASRGDQCQ